MGARVSVTSRGRFIFLNDRLRPLGLSAGQVPVLMLLFYEQNIMQETLVQYYHLDKGTIARAVKKLDETGHIRRIIDPGNRRAVRLFLTEKGEKAAAELQAIDHEWENLICAGLSHKERELLYTLMQRVAQNSFLVMRKSGDSSLENK